MTMIKDLLNSPSKWCQKDNAVDDQGKPVIVQSSKACKWCLLGAIIKCYPDPWEQYQVECSIVKSIKRLYPRYNGFGAITNFNDDRLISFVQVRQVILDAGV